MGFRVVAPNPYGGRRANFEYENEALAPIGAEIVSVACPTKEDYYAAIRDADAIMVGGLAIDPDAIERMPKVKVVSTGGIGLDKIDVDACTAAGIAVVNVPDVFIEEVADQAFALFLAVNRRVLEYATIVQNREWGKAQPAPRAIPKIAGSTLGLVAFGNIGRAMARRGLGFGMRVIASDPFVSADVLRAAGVEPVEMDEVFRQADVVSCHVPLLKSTQHLISSHHFGLMKPTAIFINTSRGPVVDEAALITALDAGAILGAGLDVTEVEPVQADNPLLGRANVVITPHMASRSDTADIERRRRAGQNIAAILSGKLPRNLVNKEVATRLSLQ
ncbi:MAG: C-terminal binding protein [Chloroflexi bacterium]|nr:C-terminal binding protein [Chloroflexota bacterium]